RIDLGLGRSGHRRAELLAATDTAVGAQVDYSAEVIDGVVIPPPSGPPPLHDSAYLSAVFETLQQPGAVAPDFAVQLDQIRALLAGTFRTPAGTALRVNPGAGAGLDL